MVAARGARRVADADLLAVLGALPGIVHRELLSPDRSEVLRTAKRLRRADRALGERVPEAAAESDRVRRREHGLPVPELDRMAVQLRVREHAPSAQVHDPRDGRPERDGVQPERVASLVDLRDERQVVDAAVRTEGANRLVLDATVLRVDPVRLLHLDDLLAAHRARPAGLHLHPVALLDEGLGADLGRAFERPAVVVPNGHAADAGVAVEAHARAEVVERPVVLLQRVRDPATDLLHLRRIVQRDAVRALDDDRLEVLAAHDGAQAGAARDVLEVVHDPRDANAVLARGPDLADARQPLADLGLERLLGVHDLESPKV